MSEVASSEQENSVLSPPSGFKLRYTLEGHSDIITQIAWSADGKKLASASKDHKIQLWNTETGELMSVLEGHTDTVFGIAWSPDGEVLASVSADETMKIWDTSKGNLRSAIENEKSNAIAWCPSGKMFVSINSHYYKNKEIKVWDTQIKKQVEEMKEDLKYWSEKIVLWDVQTDKKIEGIGDFSRKMEFWDAQTEKKIEDIGEKLKNFSRKIEVTSKKIANFFIDNKVTGSGRGKLVIYSGRGDSLPFGSSHYTINNIHLKKNLINVNLLVSY